MEEGVVSELLRSPLGEIFDHQQLITDVTGSGNNWLVKKTCVYGLPHSLLGQLEINYMVANIKSRC